MSEWLAEVPEVPVVQWTIETETHCEATVVEEDVEGLPEEFPEEEEEEEQEQEQK